MPANSVTTYTTVGNREDLIEKVFMVSPTDTPFTSAIEKVAADAVYHEWQTDALRTPSAANAAVEGADATYSAQTSTTRLGNYTQIVRDTYSVSNTQEAVKKAGPNEIARLKAKKAVELKKDIEASALTNAASVTGNGTTGRQMKGAKGFLTTNVNANGGTARAFAEAQVKDILLQCYQNGGNVSQLHMSPAHKQIASTFTGNVVRQQVVDGSYNGQKAILNTAYEIYGSDFGNVMMIPNRVLSSVGSTDVFAVDTDMFALATLRAFDNVELAQTGDARNFMITWEGTLECRSPVASGIITDLS